MRTRASTRPVAVEDIAAEAVVLGGAGRALLLQIAHPAVGRGVVDHSDFASHLMDRFDGTMLYLMGSMYGSEDEIAAVRRHVNRAHAPVRGVDPVSGSAYTAYDPELQLWVAATLYETTVDVHRRVFGPLTPSEADRAYRDFSAALSNLQLSHDDWPHDRTVFDGYWGRMIGLLRVDADVLAVSRQILHPAGVPWWMRPALPLFRLVTAGLLPGSVRSLFEIGWDDRRQRRFDRVMRWTGRLYPHLPMRVRHLPRDRYVARLHRLVQGSPGSAPGTRG